MFIFVGCPLRKPVGFSIALCWLVASGNGLLHSPIAVGQDPATADVRPKDSGQKPEPKSKPKYVQAIELLPDSLAGLVRIPNVPRFRDAWKKTHLGQLMDEPSMQPFIEAQRERVKNRLESLNNKVGIKLDDIYAIASGEAVLAWVPFLNDKRRPYAVCVIADIRGQQGAADTALNTIDQDLKAGGWMRSDMQHRGATVRVYNTKPKPGQLKVEQIAITLDETRIIAADRDSVVMDVLDAINGSPKGKSISSLENFRTVLTRSSRAIRPTAQKGRGTVALEWFVKPFPMGRVVRESLGIDRGKDVDILKLLENQGFDAIKAAGGIIVTAGNQFDVLHKGFVLAPPTTDKPSKYEKAARMLQFANRPAEEIPTWAHEETASINRLNLRIEEAFWAAESLVNEAFGDEIFREIFDGIRDDEDGPQIDVEKNVLPNLDDHILMLTDNTLPADINAERLLVAIRVRNAAAIETAIRKAMEVEPDASRMDVLPGVEIWRVQRGESDDTFDSDLFSDLAIEEEEANGDQTAPLLDHWAIALVDKGPGSTAPYLMFSSHPDLLVATVKRIQEGAPGGLGSLPEVKSVTAAIQELGGKEIAFDRVVRTKLSMRVKYQLLRQGKLKESDTILARLARRMFQDEDGDQGDAINATTLPPLQQIEKFLPAGGSYVETAEDGWAVTGFFLK